VTGPSPGFTPPPRREMPQEVRERLRRKLWRDLDRPARFRRAPLAVAAGVALLAAGAVVVTQSVPSPRADLPTLATVSPTASAAPASPADLDRCYAAAETSPTVPDRSQWTLSFSTEVGGVAVIAARAGGKPLFCESTLTSVTVSDPSAAPAFARGSTTGAVFATPNGTVAGVVDPAWDSFEIRAADDKDALVAPPEKADGMFVLYTSVALGPATHLQAQQLPADDNTVRPDDNDPAYPVRDIPAVPAPLVSVVDRPAPADRASLPGRSLTDCMSSNHDPQPDRDSWQPGAAVTVKDSELIMAVNAKGVSACQWQPGPGAKKTVAEPSDQMFQSYLQFVRQPQPVDAAQMPVVTGDDGALVICGTVRADTTKMTVDLTGTTEFVTDVRSGTFISVVPDSLVDETGELDDDHLASLTTTLYDARGNELYRGPLNAH
jgi:hypothetical protein